MNSISLPDDTDIDEITRTYPVDFHPISSSDLLGRRSLNAFVLVPFCRYKCPYCSFNTARHPKTLVPQFLDALRRELDAYCHHLGVGERPLASAWIGGGTPSFLSQPDIATLLRDFTAVLNVSQATEFTFEVSPMTVDEDVLDLVASFGVRRISIGIESFSDSYLRLLGRDYTGAQAESVIGMIKSRGFDLNVDLMYRLPGQVTHEAVADFHQAVAAGADHISAFPLILRPGMNLYKRVARGILPPRPPYNEYVETFEALREEAGRLGYAHYAYNYYASQSHECKYLVNRWSSEQQDMLGLGPGAFSFLGGVAYCNTHNIHDYIHQLATTTGLAVQEGRVLSWAEYPSRYVVLGLRFFQISRPDFIRRFGVDVVDLYADAVHPLVELGWLRVTPDAVVVTRAGAPHILKIGREFYTPNNRGKLQPQYRLLGYE